MGVDTLAIVSIEPVPEDWAKRIMKKTVSTYKLDNAQDLIFYSAHRMRAEGSYQSGLMATLEPFTYWRELDAPRQTSCKSTGLVSTATHEQAEGHRIRLEGSASKLELGHNVHPGRGLHDSLAILERTFRKATDYPIPHTWNVARVDWAENFLYPSASAAKDAIYMLTQLRMPRKKNRPYEGQSIYCAGVATTWKAYLKGPEFHTHDRARLMRALCPDCDILEEEAFRTIRIEAELRARYLEYHYKTHAAAELPDDLSEHWQKQTGKAMQDDLKMKRTHEIHEAQRRLYAAYTEAQANAAYATWLKICTLGPEKTRATMRRATWYHHRKLLKEAGVALYGMALEPSRTVLDFSLDSPLRVKAA